MFRVGYGGDLRRARDVPMAILAGDERVRRAPELTVCALKLVDSVERTAVRSMIKTIDQ